MKTIRLYGDMGKRFGREFKLDVKSPAEAIRALSAQIPGFRVYLHKHKDDAYKIFTGGRNASDQIDSPCSNQEIIRIAPTVQGAGGVGKVILGIMLIVASFMTPVGIFSTSVLSTMGSLGMSLVLGGVVQMLSATDTSSDSGSSEAVVNKPSYNFNGAVNTLAQGHPVPLAYGRLVIGSAVISAGMTTL